MKTIYYISRSYPDYYDTGGGALIRKAQVEFLRKNGFKVIVVLPNYGKNKVEINDDIILTPYKINERLTYFFLKQNIIESYLDKWVKSTVKYLSNIISKNDIVFATTGGEMGGLKIGSLLKEKTGCKFVMNYHDPIVNTTVNGLYANNHDGKTNKDKIESKYLNNIDLLITSSDVNKHSLLNKNPFLSKIDLRTIYFGFIKDLKSINKTRSSKTTIIYGGAFNKLQSPEILIQAVKDIPQVKVIYIGNHQNYEPLNEYKDDCLFLPSMKYSKFLHFLSNEADIGFVSLADDYLAACVPSKIYEYINVGIPIIGALPNGDAIDIVNQNNFGFACHYKNKKLLQQNVLKIIESKTLNSIKDSIKNKKQEWAMESRMQELITLL